MQCYKFYTDEFVRVFFNKPDVDCVNCVIYLPRETSNQ